jgi:hypothetical protein
MGLAMSGLPPEAAIPDCLQHVSFVPQQVTFEAKGAANEAVSFRWQEP